MSFQNRLIKEKSPYLLQHAHNPVDWYPWGEEALQKSKEENKPILLSIGYSTCHWCHVMAHESFEDETMAKKINEYFIPIKVDREERPDIDQVYMSAVLAITGQGGWPLTVFLTPEQKPFFGGTYFPPHAKWGSPGFIDVLESIHQAWSTRTNEILESSKNLTHILQERAQKMSSGGPLREDILEQGFRQLEALYDKHYGGFGREPKFPSSHNLSFLLRYWFKTKNETALHMVLNTLDHMSAGGMYDHLGGGFHRYSTDESWQIPHFEKMLYDQAILIQTYTEGFQITHNKEYEKTIRQSCDYVLRDMQHADGGFFSAEDADSQDPYEKDITHAKEGAYYLWQKKHVEELLKDKAEIFIYLYGIKEEGNARLDPHQEFLARNVLSQEHSLDEAVKHFNKDKNEIIESLEASKKQLFSERQKRKRPYLDDKILTDWNGLMISALSRAGAVLNEPHYVESAQKTADFILQNLRDSKGRLLHRFRDSGADILGTLDDYAFFINGLLDLYEATFELKYLTEADQLREKMLELFWDEAQGGFFFTAHDSEMLIVRQKEIYDGAMPSGNSMAIWVLMRFYHMGFVDMYLEKVEKILRAFSPDVSMHPGGYTQFLSGFDYYLGPSTEIVLSATKNDPLKDIQNTIHAHYLPHKVIILNEWDKEKSSLESIKFLSETKDHKPLNGHLTVYVCTNRSCQKPVTTQNELNKILTDLTKR